MPALSYEHVRPDQPRFEVRGTPSNVGAIPEHFRTRLGTRRSLQPTHSVCGVDDGGVLGAVRHPWYAAGIILVWARALTAADLIAAAIITVYMIVGSVLEERKPVREFGAEYEAYQRRVPMLVPWKWVWARLWRPGRE